MFGDRSRVLDDHAACRRTGQISADRRKHAGGVVAGHHGCLARSGDRGRKSRHCREEVTLFGSNAERTDRCCKPVRPNQCRIRLWRLADMTAAVAVKERRLKLPGVPPPRTRAGAATVDFSHRRYQPSMVRMFLNERLLMVQRVMFAIQLQLLCHLIIACTNPSRVIRRHIPRKLGSNRYRVTSPLFSTLTFRKVTSEQVAELQACRPDLGGEPYVVSSD